MHVRILIGLALMATALPGCTSPPPEPGPSPAVTDDPAPVPESQVLVDQEGTFTAHATVATPVGWTGVYGLSDGTRADFTVPANGTMTATVTWSRTTPNDVDLVLLGPTQRYEAMEGGPTAWAADIELIVADAEPGQWAALVLSEGVVVQETFGLRVVWDPDG